MKKILIATEKPFSHEAFENIKSDLEDWAQQQERNFDTRFCRWPGKTYDGKKHSRALGGVDVFPWEGA